MSRKIFVSYRFRDAESAKNVKQLFQAQGGKCQGEPVFGDTDVTEGGESSIYRHVKGIALTCEAMLLVVGDDTHSSSWIEREIALARSIPLPIVAVRAPNATGGLPASIQGVPAIPFVPWGHDSLCDALNCVRRPPR